MSTASEAQPSSLQLSSAHAEGHVSVCWIKIDGAWAAVTAGADGKLVTRQLRQQKEIKSIDTPGAAVTCLAVSPDGSIAATADAKNYIKTWHLPELLPTKAPIGRFSLPPRCCCWSRDGSQLAAAGDDGIIKLMTSKDGKTLRQMRCDGFVRGLALDPEQQYLAAANADGSVLVYNLADKCQQELKKVIAPKLDHDVETARQALAWHPDGGTLLAVAGRDNDVLLLERLSWRPTGYFSGGHSANVNVIVFSPNGMYAASAGGDNKLVIWLVEKELQVASCRLPCAASSLAWHPQNNALLVGAANGGLTVWAGPVPADWVERRSPWKPVDEVLREADEKAAAAGVSKSEGGTLEDDDLEDEEADDDEDDGGGAVIRRRGLKSRAAAADDGAASLDDILDELDDAAEQAAAAANDYRAGGAAAAAGGAAAGGRQHGAVVTYRPMKPQAAIHPGSTPAGSGGSGGRFLTYNQLGAVVSKEVDDHHVIEVSFHDTSRQRARVPSLTDYYCFSAASLGPRGVAYISPASGEEQPSMLLYRSFEAWATGSEQWSVALPAGEEAVVVAAGSSAVAVATSVRLLRLYSLAGRQLAAISLAGPAIALVAADPGAVTSGGAAAAAAQHLLGLVWAEGPPQADSGTQQLGYAVYDVSRSAQCCCGRLVLSRGACLTWLAFSREGLLTTMDSIGVLRVRSPEWGGSWLQVLDAAAAKATAGADKLWPGWLDCNTLMAVVTTSKAPHPQVSPRPLVTPIALSVPSAPADQAPAQLEEAAIRAALGTAQLKATADSVEDASEAAALSEEVDAAAREADKGALRLFNAYLKSAKQARALELVGCLHALKSIEGALKLANHHKLPALAERIQAFLEERLEWEQQQQQENTAAAGAAYYQQQQAWAADSGMQEQQEEASAAHGGPAPAKLSQAAAFGGAAKRAGAAAGAAAAVAGGAAKRKPLLDAADTTNRSNPGTNPFARKKAAN